MRIIVASNNIFRRELTGFVLHEAGYDIDEVRTLESLLAKLGEADLVALVVDGQLAGAPEPLATLRAVRQVTRVPILWIVEPAAAGALLLGDAEPADAVQWPYSADDLRGRLALLQHRAAAQAAESGQARAIGSHK